MRFSSYAMNLLEKDEEFDIVEIEKGFRAAALKDGNAAFCNFLSLIEAPSLQCPECNASLSKIDERDKNIVSLLGTGTFRRSYYECPNGHGHFIPCDDVIGVRGTAYTPGVRFATSKLASAGSFEWASEALADVAEIYISQKEIQRISETVGEAIESKNKIHIEATKIPESSRSQLSEYADPINNNGMTMYIEYDGTGVPMTKRELLGRNGKQADGGAKTREAKLGCIFTQTTYDDKGNPVRSNNSTSYFVAIETSETFGWRVYAEAIRRDLKNYSRIVVLGDGAKWIWGIANKHFPKTICIVDLYHAIEHLSKLAQEMFPNRYDQTVDLHDWKETLKSGDIEILVDKITRIPNLSEKQKEKAKTEANYFSENADRMRYAEFKKMGLFVGSGVIEAGCKKVIGQRLKQSGMFWSLPGANAIIALRCADLSCNDDFTNIFEQKHNFVYAKSA